MTEHIQCRKLSDRDPRLPLLADKVLAKARVGERIGDRWLVPTLWRGVRLPREAAWQMPFVVKSRHGCGHVCVVHNDADYRTALRRSRRWMAGRYGRWLDEWLYGEIELGLLVEPFLGKGFTLPLDYKLFVFGGRVRYVQVHLDRATNHRWIVFDLEWHRVSQPVAELDPVPPVSLPQMIVAAEELGRDFDFVRADFYEIDGHPLFGELTFYPGSGLEPLEPASLNEAMGAWWSAVRKDQSLVEYQ
ncbi:polysaccharide biosynthesis protein (plasmid) [Polymorphobacter sp. PAMC 29334]|uniref:ATP-grasp fold amidoligase family protein n=1 Tax=Polymorphobacter sp. PAMC 29334 TaxID=2862331 RepID=UPI001C78D4D8|nr:ATP-grasp fold amidoligase family protein [Polymorphobacter sp. PAMC 29334]QYE33086.1 polysaccharide biosynthesis protein [Polymorphobacter sp. PAMC 29334]